VGARVKLHGVQDPVAFMGPLSCQVPDYMAAADYDETAALPPALPLHLPLPLPGGHGSVEAADGGPGAGPQGASPVHRARASPLSPPPNAFASDLRDSFSLPSFLRRSPDVSGAAGPLPRSVSRALPPETASPQVSVRAALAGVSSRALDGPALAWDRDTASETVRAQSLRRVMLEPQPLHPRSTMQASRAAGHGRVRATQLGGGEPGWAAAGAPSRPATRAWGASRT
jgi:hypothetical protein